MYWIGLLDKSGALSSHYWKKSDREKGGGSNKARAKRQFRSYYYQGESFYKEKEIDARQQAKLHLNFVYHTYSNNQGF